MEIPKEVRVFETYEEAAQFIAKYEEANTRTVLEKEERRQKDHPRDISELVEGLELICPIELVARNINQKRIYKFDGGHINDFLVSSEGEYSSIVEIAGQVKEWIEAKKRVSYMDVVPFVYTVARHPPKDNESFKNELNREIKRFAGWLKELGVEFPLAQILLETHDVRFSDLNQEERGEFRKAFFGE